MDRPSRKLSPSTPIRANGIADRVRPLRRAAGWLGAAAFAAACAATPGVPPFDGYLQLGTWGGDSAGLIVSDTAMHLHIACTFGDVSGRIAVDDAGHFDVNGTYVLRAYPIMIGPGLPARFVGTLRRGVATITVTVQDTVEHQTVVRGPVSVRWGEDPRLGPCPICRRPIITRIPGAAPE
jgi:hypothetical protein